VVLAKNKVICLGAATGENNIAGPASGKSSHRHSRLFNLQPCGSAKPMHRRRVGWRAHRLLHGDHGRFAQWRCGIIIKIERRHRHHGRDLDNLA
jgi:hypothetical protein